LFLAWEINWKNRNHRAAHFSIDAPADGVTARFPDTPTHGGTMVAIVVEHHRLTGRKHDRQRHKRIFNAEEMDPYVALLAVPCLAWAESGHQAVAASAMAGTFWGITALVLFVLAYSLVPLENTIHLRKSKPVLFAAGIIWVLVAVAYARVGDTHTAHVALQHSLLEYAELFLFLLAAMTYINAMEERNVFQTLRAFLVSRGFSLRKIFWITGALAFLISPIADNLTTALLMGAVVMAVGARTRALSPSPASTPWLRPTPAAPFRPSAISPPSWSGRKAKFSFTQFFNIFIPSVSTG
jgi:hypothetical protein